MVQHVGTLGDQRVAIPRNSLDQALDGLLAEFLRNLCGATREQPSGVTDRGIGVAALLDDREQPVQNRHIRSRDSSNIVGGPRLLRLSGRLPRGLSWRLLR